MDGRRFDRLTRQLIAAGTRRGLLRLLGALPVIGALAALRDEEAAADRPLDRVRHRAKRHQRRQHHPNQHKRKRRAKGHAGARGSGDCRLLFQSCGRFAGTCCNEPKVQCAASRVAVTHCQLPCNSDADCVSYYPGADLVCVGTTKCQFLPPPKKCCLPKTCTSNLDCPRSAKCCTSSIGSVHECCLPIQKCGIFGCEY
jgi:hypothetical protein